MKSSHDVFKKHMNLINNQSKSIVEAYDRMKPHVKADDVETAQSSCDLFNDFENATPTCMDLTVHDNCKNENNKQKSAISIELPRPKRRTVCAPIEVWDIFDNMKEVMIF